MTALEQPVYRSSAPQIFRVFEHEELRIGNQQGQIVFTEAHLETLVRYNKYKNSKYYSLIHRGVRFRQYVGVLQTGNLLIEILPKAGKAELAEAEHWQLILLKMLRNCRLLRVEVQPARAIGVQLHTVLDWFAAYFLGELERLLDRGLLRAYRQKEANRRIWRGRLLINRQITENLSRKDRIYTVHDTYTFDHTLNRVLKAALHLLLRLPVAPVVQQWSQRLLLRMPMPQIRASQFTGADFERLPHQRKAHAYEPVIELARLLLTNYSPSPRAGEHQLLALLFDMNLLFEEYVFRQLKKALVGQTGELSRQIRRPFWHHRAIQPDIVWRQGDETVVLDTKWKVPSGGRPSMTDLKQLYIYGRYFSATRVILLYPKIGEQLDQAPWAFAPEAGEALSPLYCQICFLELLIEGQLNSNLGSTILQTLEANPE